MHHTRCITCLILALACLTDVSASDWLTMPSTYTHDVSSGARVTQYSAVQGPAAPTAPNFRTSGYTHTRSSLNYGQSADNYHRVEQWGDQVRPYGEWRFPFRPYSTPYPNWGAPYAGLNLGLGGFGPYGQGPSYGGFNNDRNQRGRDRLQNSPNLSNPLNPYPIGPNSAYPDAPYFDGYHPNYRQ